MNTVMGTEIVSGRTVPSAFFGAQVVSGVAAAIVLALFVVGVSQTASPLAYLVGMSPIAWIAVEGVWRLFR
jgi:hypothetical protein